MKNEKTHEDTETVETIGMKMQKLVGRTIVSANESSIQLDNGRRIYLSEEEIENICN